MGKQSHFDLKGTMQKLAVFFFSFMLLAFLSNGIDKVNMQPLIDAYPDWTWMLLISLRVLSIQLLMLTLERRLRKARPNLILLSGIIIYLVGLLIVTAYSTIEHIPLRPSNLAESLGIMLLAIGLLIRGSHH